MATNIYYSDVTSANDVKTGVQDIDTVANFTWPANAATGDLVVLAYIPAGATMLSWEFEILGTKIATTAPFSIGDGNTANGTVTVAGMNNYVNAATGDAKTFVGVNSVGTTYGTFTAPLGPGQGASAPFSMAGYAYPTTIATTTLATCAALSVAANFSGFRGSATSFGVGGVVDAVMLICGTLATGAKGVIRFVTRYTLQAP